MILTVRSFALADDAVKRAVKTGTWVLLKNVHLAPAWLSKLEKSLHIAQPHPEFRLFLTMEMNDKVRVRWFYGCAVSDVPVV